MHVLFVAGGTFGSRLVNEYNADSRKNPPPFATISTGISKAVAVAVDPAGMVYVANSGTNSVTEYPPGSSSPSSTLTAGLTGPSAVAVDRNGMLAVANGGSPLNTVVEFPPGGSTPSVTITCTVTPAALAFDASGTLYIGDRGVSSPSRIYAVAAGTSTCTNLGVVGVQSITGIVLDAGGNLWVADAANGTVSMYAPGSKYPAPFSLSGFAFPSALALDDKQRLYVADSLEEAVLRFPYMKTSPVVAWMNQTGAVTTIAVWPHV